MDVKRPPCLRRVASASFRFGEKALPVWVVAVAALLGAPAQAQDQLASTTPNRYASYQALGIQEGTLLKLSRAVSVDLDGGVLEEALSTIADQAGLQLIYADWDVLRRHRVTLDLEGKTALEALYEAVRGTGFHFKVAPGGHLLLAKDAPWETAERPTSAVFPVSGTVTSVEEGAPLPGVNVVVKGTTIGAVTDGDGNYALEAPTALDTLVFSFVGFLEQEVPIAERDVIDVALAEDLEELDEVVVVGYGEKSRRLMTESIGNVGEEEIKKVTVASPDQAIAGRVPGVQVTQSGGAPGNPVQVRIRGIGTTGTAQPLYVVDGVPVGNAYTTNGGSNAKRFNPLQTINPNDIESISVLKDASAAAVYGVRAANGVVLITTKRGAQGNPRVNVDASYGVQNVADHWDFLGTGDYVMLLREAYANYNAQFGLTGDDAEQLHPDLQPGSPFLEINNTDAWREEIVNENAPVQDYNLSVSGGNEQLNYFVSANYFDQRATMVNYGTRRIAFRANSDFTVGNRLQIGENFAVAHSDLEWGRDLGAYGPTLGMPPFFSIYDPEGEIENNRYGYHGNFERAGLTVDNPILKARENFTNVAATNVNGAFYGLLDIAGGLSFKQQVAGDVTFGDNWLREAETTPEEAGRATADRSDANLTRNFTGVSTSTLTYDGVWGAHTVNALGGFEYQYIQNQAIGARASGFLSQDPAFRRNVGAGQETQVTNTGIGERAYVGLFTRVGYNYGDRYLLTGTLRRDGSSIFNPAGGRQWGTFPSFSAAWRLSEEPFFQVPAVSELKLRGSWGQLGNDETLAYGYIFLVSTTPDYTLNGNETVMGPVPQAFVNPNLTWETVESWDVGVDVSLFNNRLDVLATYYRRITEDFLINVPIPFLTGFVIGDGTASAAVNAGNVLNSGLEFEIDYTASLGDVLLDVGLNLTTVHNELTALTPGIEEFLQLGGFRTAVGEPIAYMYGYETDGLYRTAADTTGAPMDVVAGGRRPQPGDVRFVDRARPCTADDVASGACDEGQRTIAEPDGMITPDDRTFLGKPNPDAYYGINLAATYKRFDASVFFQGSWGGSLINRFAQDRLNVSSLRGDNFLTGALDRWTPENPDADLPRAVLNDPNANWRVSDLVVERADYLRLRNLQVGYTLPPSLLGATGRTARVYLNATNLFLWSTYSGPDPEVMDIRTAASPTGRDFDTVKGGTAYDEGFLPAPRTFQVGFQLQF